RDVVPSRKQAGEERVDGGRRARPQGLESGDTLDERGPEPADEREEARQGLLLGVDGLIVALQEPTLPGEQVSSRGGRFQGARELDPVDLLERRLRDQVDLLADRRDPVL